MNVRKILIPAVAGLFISPALMAADIDTPSATRTISDEFLATAVPADTVLGDVLAVDLGAEYAVGDIITLSFSGAALDTGLLSSIVVPEDVGLGTEKNGITLGLLSSDASQAVYRVTDIVVSATNNSTIGVVVPFAAADALAFDAQAVGAASGVTVGYAAATDTGLALDTGGGVLNSTDYITTDSQFSASVDTPFDGIIDVDANRELFVGAATADAMSVTPVNTGGTFTSAATLVDFDYVVTGDFSWIVDDDDVTADIQPIAGVVTLPGTCAGLAVTSTEISYTCTNATATALTFDVTTNVDGGGNASVLPAGAFAVTVDVNYTGIGAVAGSDSLLSGAAGSWALNGFQALIPYMPYGSGIGQVIYLANRGTKVGDVTVDWIDIDGSSGSLGVIASLGAGTTLSIGPTIQAALPTAQQTSGRLALTVTANVPAADVQINSQYNASGNRAFSLHEDNRP